MTLAIDLLNPSSEAELRKHKLKRLVQSPNSFFMDVKCPGCFQITTVFSHASTAVQCGSCQTILCQPRGGKARLQEGASRLLPLFPPLPKQLPPPATPSTLPSTPEDER
ncbi:ribosomal protein S27-domain-containing protein [Mrakia frigida]|uniref:40S ribosomal protein S27 n=1 Tax=Mrakia frigida TaxID=29902 RepID=UPI003FCBFB1C